ncbi:MAG: hypothetical protein R3B68_03280 [Phycisphaerales bacterium]
MAKIEIYRQKRVDGGIRTGFSVDGARLLQHLQAGSPEPDPALEWFIDIRCTVRGKGPASESEAQTWLTEHSEFLRDALRAAADDIPVGIDADLWPHIQEINAPKGWKVVVAYSAIKRVDGRQMASHLRAWAKQFNSVARKLAA